jgi:hypothetical protein
LRKILHTTFVCLIISIFFNTKIRAQNYWQQAVNYDIHVKLNDTLHTLEGIEKFTYTNNSPDTLKYLYLHLWPNAYKNDRTAFNKQKVLNGDTKFYYSKPSERGYIKNILFTVNGRQVSYSDYNSMEDVVLLNLPEPLLPNKSVEVSTPFLVKIPKIFSRMGHSTQDYEITQWYIKPAVYDQEGWHPMPYLDQGEFYSEYGTFDVHIEVPQNFVVAATGDLQTASEIKYINEKIESTKKLSKEQISELATKKIKTDYTYKQLHYMQKDVHDFAWFADKNFLIEKSEQPLQNGKKVETYCYYLPQNAELWKGQTEAINYTVKFLSDSVGNYPYSHASAVDGGLLAGSGMEYPNVTVIGKVGNRKTLSTVIIHEVGHNWFYGLLGNNERQYAWMDEGFNTFYEHKIDKSFTEIQNKKNNVPAEKENAFNFDANSMLPLVTSQHRHSAASNHSANYGAIAYGLSVYMKAAGILKHMEAYLGADVFANCMKEYFTQFCYKHPTPKDVQNTFEKVSDKDLSCFFKELLPTTKTVDFKIKSVTKNGSTSTVTIKNKTKTNAPALVSFIKDNKIIEERTTEPFTKSTSLQTTALFDKIYLDYNNVTADVNLKNNLYRSKGILKRQRFAFKPLLGFGNYTTQNTYALPIIGYNYYDGLLVGLALHNIQTVQQKLTYLVLPMYGTNSNKLSGATSLAYNIYPNKLFKNITLMLSASKFSTDISTLNNTKKTMGNFIKIVPKIIFTLPNNKYPEFVSKTISLKHNIIGRSDIGYSNLFADSLYRPFTKKAKFNAISQLVYTHANARTLNPFSYELDAHGNNSFAKISATGKIKMNYNLPKKALQIRAFAGKMFVFTPNVYDVAEYRFATTALANNDYLFDNYFVGRDAYKKVLSNQVDMREGGAKIATPLLANPLGQSDNYLLALNVSSDLPIKLPIGLRLFADVATTKNKDLSYGIRKENMASGGLQMNLFNNTMQINLPLVMSNNYKSYFQSTYGKKYIWQSMSFQINFNRMDLYKLRNNSLLNKLF